jgi:glycosyltransferase involved in cell wall biosynthesis
MKEKGLFDALEGVALANARLGETHSPLRFKLVVAGEFINSQDRVEFDQRVAALASGARPTEVDYLGFVSGAGKRQAFANSDVFCFPTFYPAESFGLVVVEAMAFGLPVVTTQWRSIPEILPANYPGLVAWCAPEQIADVLIARLSEGDGLALRAHFLEHFTVEQHLKALAQALHRLEPKP